MKGRLLALNHAIILWGSTLYVGLLWALHFFWFPSWTHLTVANYYDQFIPQTVAATKFFTFWLPVTFACLLVMMWSERHTRFRWVPWVAMLFAVISAAVGKWLIFPINDTLATHVTEQSFLTEELTSWIFYNNVRWVTETLCWMVVMYYFVAKGDLPHRIEQDLAP